MMQPQPLNFPMAHDAYMAHLRELVLAVVEVYGEMTVGACHERVNQAIVMYGITDAAKRIRENRGRL